MIELFRQMIVGVTASALFSTVMLTFVRKSALQEVVRLATGMLMMLALLLPLTHLSIPSLPEWMHAANDTIRTQAAQAISVNDEYSMSGFEQTISQYLTENIERLGVRCEIQTDMVEKKDVPVINCVTVTTRTLTNNERDGITALVTESCGIAAGNICIVEDANHD